VGDFLHYIFDNFRRAPGSHRELPGTSERRWRVDQGGIARRVNGLLHRKKTRCSYAEHGIDKPETSDGNGSLIR
jgi:hypothetical protein